MALPVWKIDDKPQFVSIDSSGLKVNYTDPNDYEAVVTDASVEVNFGRKKIKDLRYRGEAYYLTGQCREAIIDLANLLDIEQPNKFALRYQEEAYYIMKI
ncbi:hypothetical protein C2G38_2190012 [Gigaspora rosea]|uniref:Uncharacterized protein n=1 Tax=Gigaspora rosea TaxID=44941 RepID=A0A397V398_9GLOM|nr:hypothetical protein C2G38_2190012 [Gigaspora rosea]